MSDLKRLARKAMLEGWNEDAPPTLFMDFHRAATPEAILNLHKQLEEQVEGRDRALDKWNSALDKIEKAEDEKVELRTEFLRLKESTTALMRGVEQAENTVDRLALILGFGDSKTLSIDAATLMAEFKRLKEQVERKCEDCDQPVSHPMVRHCGACA